MEELFSYKKKFEEEKGRSVSTLQVRSAEEYARVKTLENELMKKETIIRKLEKEVISLEKDNVNLTIQVMTKLDNAPNLSTPQ
jgi:regulator of PEP synthase PpsR (kinase-PPPase family)